MVLAIAASLLLVAAAPASAADTAAPQLVEFDFTPKIVNVSTASQTVTVTMRITDNESGAEAPYLLFDSRETTQTAGFGQTTRISGTANDGVYQRTVTIPQGAAPGTWDALLYPLEDSAGNSNSSFGPPAGFPKELTVTEAPVCDATWKGGTASWNTPAQWTLTNPDSGSDGLPDQDDMVCISSGTATVNAADIIIEELNVDGNGKLVLDGFDIYTDAPGGIFPDGVVNVGSGGVIQLTATTAHRSAELWGLTLNNSGTIRTLAGGGGADATRTLGFNQATNAAGGMFDFDVKSSLSVASFVNNGTINVDSPLGSPTRFAMTNSTFNQSGGTIQGPGALLIGESVSYNHNGGTVAAGTTVAMSGANLNAQGPGVATYTVTGGDTKLTAGIDGSKTIRVVGRLPGAASVTASANLNNWGTIVLTNANDGIVASPGDATLSTGGFTLGNAGVIRTETSGNPGAGSNLRTIAGTGTLLNSFLGTFDVLVDTALTGNFTNGGHLNIGPSATVTVGANNFAQTQSSAVTDVTGVLDPVGGALVVGGGGLAGRGTVRGDVNSTGGDVRPGGSLPGLFGTLTIDGNYTQGADGSLRVDVAANQQDRLHVSGSASIGGGLFVESAGYTPTDGDSIDVLTTSTGPVTGQFASKTTHNGGGRTYDATFFAGPPGLVQLTVTPVTPTPRHTLAITKAGNGSGAVRTTPGSEVACGDDCTESYDEGTSVTLTAEAHQHNTFTGWSGDAACTGTGPCQVTMSQARTVTATFVSNDRDGDGVFDGRDDCPDVAGSSPGGCPPPTSQQPGPITAGPDRDGDGVPDTADKCPDVDGGNANGCPADSDGDGVPDSADPEPSNASVPGAFGATNGNNALTGTAVGERICGLLGNDVVKAGGGNDTVFGDLCDVKAKSVAGAQAGAGGADTLYGGTGNDSVYGAGGADKLFGDDGNDKLFGGDGNDSLSGGKGKDTVDGGKGNDKLTGGSDVNTYKGGSGDDTVSARNKKKDTIDCGAGKKDKATVDKIDKVKGCEKVSRK